MVFLDAPGEHSEFNRLQWDGFLNLITIYKTASMEHFKTPPN